MPFFKYSSIFKWGAPAKNDKMEHSRFYDLRIERYKIKI